MKNSFCDITKEEMSAIIGGGVKRHKLISKNETFIHIINSKYVIKVPVSEKTACNLQKEITISNALKKYSLPLKTPIWKRVDLVPNDYRSEQVSFCAIAPRITGKHPISLNDPKLLSDLGCFLAALHKIPSTAFEGVLTYMDLDFNYMVDTWEKQGRNNGVDKDKWKLFKDHLKSTVLIPSNNVFMQKIGPVLTHADLYPKNVLIGKDGRLVGVLDFGNATLTPEPQDVLIAGQTIPNGSAMLNAYQSHLGRRVESQDKLQQTWRLAAQMNTQAEGLLSEFLEHERQRG